MRATSPLSVLTFPVELFVKLRGEVKKFLKKKKTRERLFNALSDEIITYVSTFERLVTVGETRFVPLLDELKDTLNVSQMNSLLDSLSDAQFHYSDLLESFVELSKGCNEISFNEAFMTYLKESSDLLHDFVLSMKNLLIATDRIKIDRKFYRFLKLYEDELLKGLKTSDVDSAVEELKGYIPKIERVKQSFRVKAVKRKIRRRYKDSLQKLKKASKKVKIQKTKLVELRVYVPSKLLPLVILFDEIFGKT